MNNSEIIERIVRLLSELKDEPRKEQKAVTLNLHLFGGPKLAPCHGMFFLRREE